MNIKKIIFLSFILLSSCTNTKPEEKEEYPDHLTFSHTSGFYDQDFFLNIKAPKGYSVYYTTDNTDPDESSNIYNSPILIKDNSNNPNYYSLKNNISSLDVYYPSQLINKCQIIKVIGIDPITKDKTPISCLNYFVGYQNKDGYLNMPVVSLTINDDDLFDYEKGIYVTGKIYDEEEHVGYPESYPANYQQKGKEIEREAYFKYFDESKEIILEQNIGVRIHGG